MDDPYLNYHHNNKYNNIIIIICNYKKNNKYPIFSLVFKSNIKF